MKRNFGIRFMLRSAMSLALGLLSTWVTLRLFQNADFTINNLAEASSWFAFWFIILGYYQGLKTLVKTRVGPFAYLLYLIIGAGLSFVVMILGISIFTMVQETLPVPWFVLFWTIAAPLLVAFGPPFLLYRSQTMKENPLYRQWFLEGKGGSARWASVGTFDGIRGKLKQSALGFWFNRKGARADGIYVGRSLLDDDPFQRHLVIKNSEHFMTLGTTGAGKAISALFINFSLYLGSIIGFDPKGELCRMTANSRNHKNIGGPGKTTKHLENGVVHILDPTGLMEQDNYKSNCYNPLLDIDSKDSRARQYLAALSDAIVLTERGENKHFEEVPKMIFEAFVAHVLTTYPRADHTLPFVYDLIRGVNPKTRKVDFDFQQEVLLQMVKNDAMGGIVQEGGRILIEVGPNERGSMISTLSRNLKWIGEPQMREHLSDSDFSFSDIGVKTMMVNGKEEKIIHTIYVILPDQMIKEQMRWLRMIFSFGIRVMQERDRNLLPDIPTLVVIDEFARLGGKIEVIAEGFGILRSFGIRLWTLNQSLGQLKADYPGRWGDMISNSTVQIFGAGMGDPETAEWVSRTLGSRIIRKKEWSKNWLGLPYKKIVDEAPRELLTPAEVTTKLGKTSNLQIILPNEGLPMRLERLSFKALKFGKRKFKALGLGGLKGQIEE